MSIDPINDELRTVRETGVQYVVNAEGKKLGVLLSLEEYERYLRLLKSKAEDRDSGRKAAGTETLDKPADLVYPTRLVAAEKLDRLTGLAAVGGDALADSEALYDPDRH